MRRKEVDIITSVLLVLAGLNWGIYGVFDINPVGTFLSFAPVLAQVVYALFGAAALYTMWKCIRDSVGTHR